MSGLSKDNGKWPITKIKEQPEQKVKFSRIKVIDPSGNKVRVDLIEGNNTVKDLRQQLDAFYGIKKTAGFYVRERSGGPSVPFLDSVHLEDGAEIHFNWKSLPRLKPVKIILS